MKEGYWIKARTGEKWQVQEHARFAQSPEGAEAMGLPQRVRDEIAAIDWDFNGPNRESIVLAVCKAGYVRMRGHGAAWAFEFWGDASNALWAIYQFTADWGGPFTGMLVNNLKTNEQWRGSFQEFKSLLTGEGPDAVMRVASTYPKLNRRSRLLNNRVARRDFRIHP